MSKLVSPGSNREEGGGKEARVIIPSMSPWLLKPLPQTMLIPNKVITLPNMAQLFLCPSSRALTLLSKRMRNP